MLSHARQTLLKYLAGLALASGVGLSGSLTGIPADLVLEVLGETGDPSWRDKDRERLLGLLARDERPSVRAAVADAMFARPVFSTSTLRLLETLARDRDPAVRLRGASALAAVLSHASVLDRLQTAATWVTSDHRGPRLAIARAMSVPFPVPAADLLLRHLVADPTPAVRRAALHAARQRFLLSPEQLAEVSAIALADSDRAVRRHARQLYFSATRGPECTGRPA